MKFCGAEVFRTTKNWRFGWSWQWESAKDVTHTLDFGPIIFEFYLETK